MKTANTSLNTGHSRPELSATTFANGGKELRAAQTPNGGNTVLALSQKGGDNFHP
ncbi:hypothetical protein AB0M92_37870 [Streptomyces sp. NPDC051582]|uniref:hypothetical protein n=1 Tax=Streptomyces sp. NPDC051582 TaxID=3155167 RepID=UPI00342D9C3E